MEYKLVTRKVDDLEPDPNQPRKKFDNEVIENLAKTIDSQGIINPIEIDEHDIIITGEMRWRAAKEVELEEIECKQLQKLSQENRFLRQTIENFHHNDLSQEEETRAVLRLKEMFSSWTQTKLASKIGRSPNFVSDCLKMPLIEKKFGKNNLEDLGKKKAIIIDQAIKNPIEQKQLVQKVVREGISTNDLVGFVREIKDMPSDIKTEILKPDSDITLEDAIDISQVKDSNLRKESIKFIKKQKKDQELMKEYIGEIARGEKEPYKEVKVDHFDMKFINQSQELAKKIMIKWRKKNVESYKQQTQIKIEKIIRKMQEFLRKEWGERTQIIDIKKQKENDIIEI